MIATDRRRFLSATGLALGAMTVPGWARGAHGGTLARKGSDVLSGDRFTMTVDDASFATGRRHGPAVTVNGTLPGPLLRLKEGQELDVELVNNARDGTSIHWHGMLVPFAMDGVPGVTMAAVPTGGTFHYRFPIRQSGTYWWHAHSMQEPMGHYGPIVIDPIEPDPFAYDREYVLLLSDWSPIDPHEIVRRLKVADAPFNFHKTTWTDDYPLSAEQRRMWARMRMSPTDISDVTGSTYSYLVNGYGPADGLELAFNPGERIRLRIINGSAMTFFNVRIPGLPMTVVSADGQNVRPVETDEFQMGVAETYDVIVQPHGADAFTFVAEAIDRSGMGLAMLAGRPGARAPIPPLRKPPLLTMADMGMGSNQASSSGDTATGMDHGAAAAANQPAMPGMNMSKDTSMPGMDMSKDSSMAGMNMSGGSMAGMNMRDTSKLPPNVKVGPGLDMVAMNPADRMGDPGIGLKDVDHRVLTYRQLVAAKPNPDQRAPTRLKEIHLTGNMERYMWSFDGKKFSAVTDDPIRFARNERVRIKLVNDTMMAHPIHLHGHFFELDNGAPDGMKPRKHTVVVQPGGSATFDLTADAPGDWAFHCHLFYHMHAGMFQVVTVRPLEGGA